MMSISFWYCCRKVPCKMSRIVNCGAGVIVCLCCLYCDQKELQDTVASSSQTSAQLASVVAENKVCWLCFVLFAASNCKKRPFQTSCLLSGTDLQFLGPSETPAEAAGELTVSVSHCVPVYLSVYARSKLNCLVTSARMREWLPAYSTSEWMRTEPSTCLSQIQRSIHYALQPQSPNCDTV